MLIWIENSLSPQEIHEQLLLDNNESFKQQILKYLESSHQGDFLGSTMKCMEENTPTVKVCRTKPGIYETNPNLMADSTDDDYMDPTLSLPIPPPVVTHAISETDHSNYTDNIDSCESCNLLEKWWHQFRDTVNDIIFQCNVYSYGDEICKACFPRDIHEHTTIDDDGHICLKKLEPMLNTFSLPVSYITWCNTDVTTLLSGTAIKAIVSYVTDYITKPMLKSHQIFSAAYDIYQRNIHLADTKNDRIQSARKL
ncbi:hypothetical protein FA15DRAFT_592606 [Coprinopsis marcescibilis]|uniref:Uncharacterized protein n=1 Tax=Coprinopsis marcescibilis TaxID=230819 RepID=A0A5C3KWU4_COPMA|nr:hypothetical protein FA15DRAFT_592606 [Coprinopsis marcescibilis]